VATIHKEKRALKFGYCRSERTIDIF
jgi:hypothetical protein